MRIISTYIFLTHMLVSMALLADWGPPASIPGLEGWRDDAYQNTWPNSLTQNVPPETLIYLRGQTTIQSTCADFIIVDYTEDQQRTVPYTQSSFGVYSIWNDDNVCVLQPTYPLLHGHEYGVHIGESGYFEPRGPSEVGFFTVDSESAVIPDLIDFRLDVEATELQNQPSCGNRYPDVNGQIYQDEHAAPILYLALTGDGLPEHVSEIRRARAAYLHEDRVSDMLILDGAEPEEVVSFVGITLTGDVIAQTEPEVVVFNVNESGCALISGVMPIDVLLIGFGITRRQRKTYSIFQQIKNTSST